MISEKSYSLWASAKERGCSMQPSWSHSQNSRGSDQYLKFSISNSISREIAYFEPIPCFLEIFFELL